MALEGLGRVSVSRDSARPLPRLLPARGLFLLLLLILISGFPHPCSPRGGALGCQPHRFQASFLENLWTVSLFLSLLKSRSQCCLGSVANHGPMRVPVPTVTLHVGLALRATTARGITGREAGFQERSGRADGPIGVSANVHLGSGCCIITSTCMFPLYQTEPALSPSNHVDVCWQCARP